MKYAVIFLLFFLVSGWAFSQQPSASFDFENATEETPLYTIVEKMPEPKGGMEAFYKAIASNMQYPEEARIKGLEGKVFVRFVVTAAGKIESVEMLKGINPALDEEAVRLIKLSGDQPGWIPGMDQGEEVDVQIVQQVLFRLQAAPAEQALPKEQKEQAAEGSKEQALHKSAIIYNNAHMMPVPKEGWHAYHSLLRSNFNYPETELTAKIQGTVYLEYIIDKDSTLSNVSIKRGVSDLLNEEALRQLMLADRTIGWAPGIVDGLAVNTRVVMPVHFYYNYRKVPVYRGSVHVSPEEAERMIAFDNLPVAEEVGGTLIYHKPEHYPVPEAGVGVLNHFFALNLVFPEAVGEELSRGEVIISFIVSSKGVASDEKVIKSVHPAMDAEALRLMRLFNKENAWKPALYRDRKVAAYVEVPVKYDNYPQQTQSHPIEKIVRDEYYIDSTQSASKIFDNPEEEATPKGDLRSFYRFIYENIEYPLQAIRSGKEGTIYVRFIIDEQGNVQHAHYMKEHEVGYGLDQEAVRVVSLTKWNPAKNGGMVVQQSKIIPINFKIQKDKIDGKSKKW